jgi:hypothetical protein
MDRRLSRRKLATAIGALVLAVPALSACGFNYATDRDYTPANGTNYQDGVVDVLNAVIVASEDGSGTFIASLSNNAPDESISFDALSFGSNSTIEVAPFDPVEVPPMSLVNLGDGQGIKVSGDIVTGDFIELSLAFSNGETADMDVPIVAAEYEYTNLDVGTGIPAPAGTPSASESAE